MAKKKTKKHRKPTVALAVVAGLAPLAMTTWDGWKHGGVKPAANNFVSALTGYNMDKKIFWAPGLKNGAVPAAVGVLVHKVASFLGINRALARAGIPLIRI